jgi:hypothetical protein
MSMKMFLQSLQRTGMSLKKAKMDSREKNSAIQPSAEVSMFLKM